ncbi:MAG TPA: hypothetical protein VIM16_02195 [Mucilaginibacter sp.]
MIFLLIIITFFAYLLFAPFYLEINSISGLCGVRFHRLAFAKLVISESSVKIDLWIAGWRKRIDPFAKSVKRKPTKKSIPPKQKKKPFKISFSSVKAVLKSFKINKCYLNIDSGNVQLNGLLFPGFYWLSKYTNKPLSINFLDRNEIILEIENNMARIIKALIFHLLTFKKQKSWTT